MRKQRIQESRYEGAQRHGWMENQASEWQLHDSDELQGLVNEESKKEEEKKKKGVRAIWQEKESVS